MVAELVKAYAPSYHGMRVTREEYIDLEDDGYKYDMIEGVLHMSPSADFFHGTAIIDVAAKIRAYLRKNPIALITTETDVLLPDGGDLVRPDICVVSSNRAHIIKTHVHGSPDLVVELLSKSTMHRDLGVKADRYLKNGVREYWVIDPMGKTLELWINKGDHWQKSTGDSLKSELLPGLVLEKSEIWD